MTRTEPWHLDRKIPIGLMLTLVLQLAIGVWWASQQEARLAQVQAQVADQGDRLHDVEAASQTARVGQAQLVEQIAGVKDAVDQLRQDQRETNDLLRQYFRSPK